MADLTPATTDRTYEPPRLAALGSVHELTQAGLSGSSGDGVLFLRRPGVVNGS